MSWVTDEQWFQAEPDPMIPYANDIIEHMNDDHVDAMVDIYNAHYGKNSSKVHMNDLDPRGIFIQCMETNHEVYIPYGKTITSSELRVAIIDLVKQARIKLSH